MSSNVADGRDSKITYGGFAFVCAFAALGLMMAGAAIWFGLELTDLFN
jgi:hypothetical protein